MQKKKWFKIPCLILPFIIAVQTQAVISIKVYTKDDGLNESNISKPRIYIENTGTTAISNFKCYYYFTGENGKTPVLEEYYTPNSNENLEHLNGNEYRIKYDFTGTTLQPGQVIPNTSGNCVGIRYSDWSNLDKTNDLSFNNNSSFVLNGNIPVYLADGTLIAGNEKPDPQNPPKPPVVYNALGDFAVYSTAFTDIRDRVNILGGNVGSTIYTEIGCNATIKGNVYSGGNLFLRESAILIGDAVASEYLKKQNNVRISGSERQHAEITTPQINTESFTTGSIDTLVNNSSTINLLPGNYRDFHAFSKSIVRIQPGIYTFRKFIIEPDVKIILSVTQGNQIKFKISEEMRLADRTVMSFESGVPYPLSFSVFSSQLNQLSIGTNAQIFGLFSAPAAEIHVYSNTKVNGVLYGKRVVLEPEVFLCKPPTLNGLWHSEWAFAKPFDALLFKYVAVVPDASSTLCITPYTLTVNNVTINGNAPTDTIRLLSGQTNASILLTSPDACGTTQYDLQVNKSATYMIYVNDDSPCAPGSEDGNSWGTAFKNLQAAIDKAATEGKEIWVAEGVYKPTIALNAADNRSRTFLLQPGIEIIGGFKATEITREPAGSPYNTILSGDLAGNDMATDFDILPLSTSAIANRVDNSYHVVTITGAPDIPGVHLENITVTGGFANGTNSDYSGGAIYCKYSAPDISNCVFSCNYAAKTGGAIYSDIGFRNVKKTLFNKNVAAEGPGGAVYVRGGKTVKFEQVIFNKNQVSGTGAQSKGGALSVENTEIDIVNTLISENKSNGAGCAIVANSSGISMLNCTVFGNTSNSSGGCISLLLSFANIKNGIHWNNGLEIEGTGATVTYTLIKGGYTGAGNLNSNPQFAASTNPVGIDGIWGSVDDGLRLISGSPAIGATCDSFPQLDISETFRKADAAGKDDLGAYTFIPPASSIYNEDAVFGYFKADGSFTVTDDIHVYEMFDNEWGYMLARNSNRVLYARLLVDDKKQTRDIDGGPVTISAHDSTGAEIYSKVIQAHRASNGGTINGKLVYYSVNPIMFLKDESAVDFLQSSRTSDALYFMYGNAERVASFVITAYTDDYR